MKIIINGWKTLNVPEEMETVVRHQIQSGQVTNTLIEMISDIEMDQDDEEYMDPYEDIVTVEEI